MTALTKDGELNTSFIQRELVDALEEDRTYHITDEAKKKHITTAASYDEFRHLVACADLKRVTRKDMNSLGKPEKGWQTKGNLATGTGKGKRSRKDVKGKKVGAAQIEKSFPAVAPKSPMTFDRDWRRHCSSRELKLQYLRLCGPATLRKIFRTELDVALMGQIIKVFAEAASQFHKSPGAPRTEGTASSGRVTDDVAAVQASAASPASASGSLPAGAEEMASALEFFSYMRILPETGRFSLNVEFLEDGDRENVSACLDWLALSLVKPPRGGATGPAEEGENTAAFMSDAVSQLRASFKLKL